MNNRYLLSFRYTMDKKHYKSAIDSLSSGFDISDPHKTVLSDIDNFQYNSLIFTQYLLLKKYKYLICNRCSHSKYLKPFKLWIIVLIKNIIYFNSIGTVISQLLHNGKLRLFQLQLQPLSLHQYRQQSFKCRINIVLYNIFN